MDIGTVIKERRALLGISQQDLSDYSGVGISTVKDLERRYWMWWVWKWYCR